MCFELAFKPDFSWGYGEFYLLFCFNLIKDIISESKEAFVFKKLACSVRRSVGRKNLKNCQWNTRLLFIEFILHFYGVDVCRLEMLTKLVFMHKEFFTKKVTLYHNTAAWKKNFFTLNPLHFQISFVCTCLEKVYCAFLIASLELSHHCYAYFVKRMTTGEIGSTLKLHKVSQSPKFENSFMVAQRIKWVLWKYCDHP